MKNSIKALILTLFLALSLGIAFAPVKVYAAGSDDAAIVKAETNDNDVVVAKAVTAAVVVSVVAGLGAVSMCLAIMKVADSTARQPEVASRLFIMMMLGLVFIETAIIYGLIVAIFIVFIL